MNATNISAIVKKFGAACCNSVRAIGINETFSADKIISLFVFELTNAISAKKFEEVHQAALKGKIDREEYAMKMEFIEFMGTQRHHQIMAYAIDKMGWDQSMDIYRDRDRDYSFEDYFKDIKDSPHTEFYRNYWDQNYRK